MTEATGSDMMLIVISVVVITFIAFFVATFVSSISQIDRQDYPAMLAVDKFRVENCLKLDDKLILDFNKFNSDTLKNCVDSGVSIKVNDLDGNVIQVKDSKGELIDEFNSENELSRRFPLCEVKKGRYKCRDFSGRYVVWNEGLKDYVLRIDLVTKVV